MKKQLAFLLAVLLLGGCSAGAESSAGESASLLTGETVSGIITKVNGNEITLELVTLNQPAVPEEVGEKAGAPEERPQNPEEAPRGESQAPGGDSGLSGREDRGSAPGGGNREERPSGEMPQGGAPSGEMPQGEMPSFGGGRSSQQKDYTRTGETALYQIPVGAAVLTLTGTSRGFNSLSTDLLVTITFREDGVTPGQVQVLQSLS